MSERTPGGEPLSPGAGAGTPGTVAVTVTYLQMTSPEQVLSAPGWSEAADVRRCERPDVAFYRYLYDSVGAGWGWYERRLLTDRALAEVLHHEAVEVFVLYVRDAPAGYVEFDRRVEHEVEIAYFGLMPGYIGRGLGAAFLGWALRRAWSYRPRRVWLHTCSLDHPIALSVYRRAGFEVYDRRVQRVETRLLDLPGYGRSDEVARSPSAGR